MKKPINTLKIIGIGILSFIVTTLACLLVIIFKPKDDELRLNEYQTIQSEVKQKSFHIVDADTLDLFQVIN